MKRNRREVADPINPLYGSQLGVELEELALRLLGADVSSVRVQGERYLGDPLVGE